MIFFSKLAVEQQLKKSLLSRGGDGGTIVYSGEFDFDSCPIACVVGGTVISVSKVLADELRSRAENGEETPW